MSDRSPFSAYPKEHYDMIENLVLRFQAGDQEAGSDLLEAFQPYFAKYLRLIKEAVVNFFDQESRRFIALLMSDPMTRRGIFRSNPSRKHRAAAWQAARLLQTCCQTIPEDDLKQEMYLILLKLAKRYKKQPHCNFAGYVAGGRRGAFKYELHRSLKRMIADPSVFKNSVVLSFDESMHHLPAPEEQTIQGITPTEELDHDWVRGLSAADEFSGLTPAERLIIKLHYADGLSDRKIAERLGHSSYWVKKRRRGAVDKIKAALELEARLLTEEDPHE
jgi:RNA polymerase sigma factor (sigma-70 family)